MKKLVLIDGHNLLFQMYYGMPNTILNKSGLQIQGVIGFVGGLNKIITLTEPDYLLVVFDGENKPHRQDIDLNYKANRPQFVEGEPNPFDAFYLIKNCLDYMSITYTETTTCECDDLIANYAKTYSDINIDIVSSDKDFYSLVGDKINVLTYRGKNSVRVTPQLIVAKYGIQPCQFSMFKSLVGDSSDNIKGIYKVGPKTASKLINNYPDLLNSDNEIITANLDLIKHNLQLIQFDDNMPLPFDLDKLSYQTKQLKTTEILQACKVYE